MNFERHKDPKESIGIGLDKEAMKHGSITLVIDQGKSRNEKRVSLQGEDIQSFLDNFWMKDSSKELQKSIRKTYKIRNPFIKPIILKLIITGWTGKDAQHFHAWVLYPISVRERVIYKDGETFFNIPGSKHTEEFRVPGHNDSVIKQISIIREGYANYISSLQDMQGILNKMSEIHESI